LFILAIFLARLAALLFLILSLLAFNFAKNLALLAFLPAILLALF